VATIHKLKGQLWSQLASYESLGGTVGGRALAVRVSRAPLTLHEGHTYKNPLNVDSSAGGLIGSQSSVEMSGGSR